MPCRRSLSGKFVQPLLRTNGNSPGGSIKSSSTNGSSDAAAEESDELKKLDAKLVELIKSEVSGLIMVTKTCVTTRLYVVAGCILGRMAVLLTDD